MCFVSWLLVGIFWCFDVVGFVIVLILLCDLIVACLNVIGFCLIVLLIGFGLMCCGIFSLLAACLICLMLYDGFLGVSLLCWYCLGCLVDVFASVCLLFGWFVCFACCYCG